MGTFYSISAASKGGVTITMSFTSSWNWVRYHACQFAVPPALAAVTKISLTCVTKLGHPLAFITFRDTTALDGPSMREHFAKRRDS